MSDDFPPVSRRRFQEAVLRHVAKHPGLPAYFELRGIFIDVETGRMTILHNMTVDDVIRMHIQFIEEEAARRSGLH